MDHDIARWLFVIVGLGTIAAVWLVPHCLKKRLVRVLLLREGTRGRHLKRRVYDWLVRVDEMIAERNKIIDHAGAVAWCKQTLESLERFLGTTELAKEIKTEFAVLAKEVEKATRRTVRARALNRAMQLLRDYQKKVGIADLR